MSNVRGFTLVELMVVIAVITILTALIVPEFSGTYDDARLRAAGRDLASALKLASSRAILHHREYRFRVHPDRRAYWIEAPDDHRVYVRLESGSGHLGERFRLAIRERPPVIMGGEDEVPPPVPGEESDAPSGSIRFFPDGTADGREIEIRDTSGQCLRLVVDAATGRIQPAPRRDREEDR